MEPPVYTQTTTFPRSCVRRSYVLKMVPDFDQLGVQEVTIALKIPGLPTRIFHEFHVVNTSLNTDLVLGQDFISKYQAVFDFSNQTVSIFGKLFPFNFAF